MELAVHSWVSCNCKLWFGRSRTRGVLVGARRVIVVVEESNMESWIELPTAC